MSIESEIREYRDPEKERVLPRFFKTGPGEYGEGDRFIGVTVPNIRIVAKRHVGLPLSEIDALLNSPWHEVRMAALLIMVENWKKDRKDNLRQRQSHEFYLSRTDRINNWDLVDLSAPTIVGSYLLDKPRDILYTLAESPLMWDRRIAIVSTLTLIRDGQADDTYRLAERFLSQKEDLMHKATGWMLREAGKRDQRRLCAFLDRHATSMPRTMLRYSIEKFPEPLRRHYLEQK